MGAQDSLAKTRGVLQQRTLREGGFTKAKRSRFLDALALTCNVSKAAAYAGVHPTTIYKTRIKDAVFADQMQQAMDIGFDRLEALVLEHGGAGEPIELDPDQASAGGAAPEPFDFDRAMKVLVYRRASRAGEPNRRTGRPPKNATREETNAVLFKALAAAQRRAAAARGAEGALDQRSLGQEEPGNG